MPLLVRIGDLLLAALVSPTFWTAIGAVGTVAALFFIYQQVRHARYVSAYEFLRREDDRFRTAEMMKHRSNLAMVLLLHPDDFQQIDVVVDFLLDYFEDLGLILRKGLSPAYFVWSMNCYYILRYWHALLPYITWARLEWEDNTYYSDFEYLYRNVSRLEQRQAGKMTIEFSAADLRSFLKEELNVTVRHSKPSDIKAIMRIEKASFKIDNYPESQFRDLYKSHPDGFLVAQLFEEIVGYGVAYMADDKAEFDSIAVDPRYWRLGIGTVLARRLVEHLQKQGATKCGLEVRTSNVSAVRFYEHLGFEIVRTEEDYYSDKGDAYDMEMPVASAGQPQ